MAVVSCVWKTASTMGSPPSPRYGFSVQLVRNVLFVFGGCHSAGMKNQPVFFNDFYKLSVRGECLQWEEIKPNGEIPLARDSHCMSFAENCLYLFGGKNQLISARCLEDVYRFDIENNKWERVACVGEGPSAIGFSACVCGKNIIVFGGIYNGIATSDMYLFELEQHVWTLIQPCKDTPSPRCDHGCEVVEGLMFIHGGCGRADSFLNDLQCFDIETKSWKQPVLRGLSPYPRAGHKFIAHRDKDIYVVGGYNDSCDTMRSLGGVHKLSLGSKKWKRPIAAGLHSPPAGIHGHAAFVCHSTIYVLGGVAPEGEESMQYVRILQLINPSERKPIVEHMLTDFCTKSNSLTCWMPTKLPKVSYNIKADLALTDKKCADLLISATQDSLPLNKELTASDLSDISSPELQKSLQRAAEAELAFARQNFEDERTELLRLLDNERREIRHLMESHQVQNEAWWKERQKENDNERRKFRLAWEKLEAEKQTLATEREILETKGKQVAQLLKQVTDM